MNSAGSNRRSRWMASAKTKASPNMTDQRLTVLRFGIAVVAAIIIGRLFILQVVQAGFYSSLASDQYDVYEKLFPRRGEILVQDLKDGKTYPAATNINLGFVSADPRTVQESKGGVAETAELLAQILGMNAEQQLELQDKLSKKDDGYEPIQNKVPEEKLHLIDQAKAEGKLSGIGYIRQSSRSYPEGGMGGQVLGFVGSNEDGSLSGKYGIEGYFDEELAGKQGFLQSERGAGKILLTVADGETEPAVDGSDIVLTIDRNIQYMACKALNEAVAHHQADGGSVVILDPKTGAVLAMCGSPDFDPNAYNKVDSIQVFNNPVIFNAYEPGSIFKPLTIAAAIDAGAITPATTFEDTGVVEDVGCQTPIRNSEDKVYGVQTMTQVLEESINTGVIFAMKAMGRDVFEKYVERFGFGRVTEIELNTESAGNIRSLDEKSDCYAATATFGQGITTTPLQMAASYVPLANGGHFMKPYVVSEIRHADGTVKPTKPIELHQVITEKTANLVSAMLISVVENGHGKKAGVPGYWIAGKTGTAQVAGSAGSYLANVNIGSFAGYGPVGNPRFVMVTRIDHPRDVSFAESSAAPLFGEIAQFLLRYFEVPPQR